jgi:hypothetical protein
MGAREPDANESHPTSVPVAITQKKVGDTKAGRLERSRILDEQIASWRDGCACAYHGGGK